MLHKLLLVLGVSLAGSLHCAGMCGALAACAVGVGSDRTAHRAWLANFNYHLGRLTTYTLMGALCGALGAAADLSGSLLGLQKVAAILGGAMMIGIGLVGIARALGWRISSTRRSAFLQRTVNRALQWAVRFPVSRRAMFIGLFTALLPCGWLWVFAAAAAGTASPAWGAAVMAVFWLGTVPVLAGLGQVVGSLWGRARPNLMLVMSILVIALGLWTITQRSTAAMVGTPDALQLNSTDLHTTPACCPPDEH